MKFYPDSVHHKLLKLLHFSRSYSYCKGGGAFFETQSIHIYMYEEDFEEEEQLILSVNQFVRDMTCRVKECMYD